MTVVSQIQWLAIPTPFPIGKVNVYALKGPAGAYLIDAGIVSQEARELVREWLPRPLAGILLTHAHMDHLGLAWEIAQEENCPVYVHPAEFQRLQTLERQVTMLRRLMTLGGVPEEVSRQALGNYEQSRFGYVQPLAGVDCRELADGQVFDTEIGKLEVVHTPGHAEGHCCFYCPEEQVLFSGDHIMQRTLPIPLLEEDRDGKRCRSYQHYLASVEKVRTLDVRQVYPGHGRPFTEFGEAVENFRQYHASRVERVLAQVAVGAKSPWEVLRQLYPEARGAEVFFNLSKVWGHLDVLEAAGRVRLTVRGKVPVYGGV